MPADLSRLVEEFESAVIADSGYSTVTTERRYYAAKKNLLAAIAEIVKKNRDFEASFELRWDADMRAIKRWRAEDPARRELIMPDHADLCCWLIKQLENAEKEAKHG